MNGLSLNAMMDAGGNQTMAGLNRAEGEDADKRETESRGGRYEGEDADKREGGDGSGDSGASGSSGDSDSSGSSGDSSSAPAPTLALTSSKSAMELGESATLSAALSSGTATSYKFQIRRASGRTWHDISEGSSATFTGVARVAGQLRLRSVARVGTADLTSSEASVSVRFPSFTTVSGNATVKGFCDTAWANTKAATTSTSRREEGFWIQLNTQNMTYQKTATVVGPTRTNAQGASVDFGARAADNPTNPAPNAHAVYTVASFHTHTPMTYRTGTRVTGPSGADQRIDTSDDICGLVYDWTANPARGGHPLTDAAQIYHSGPTRRSTPG